MKNKSLIAALTVTFYAFACDNQEKQIMEKTETATEQTFPEETKPVESAFTLTANEFAIEAYETNMKEIILAQLATQQAKEAEVKSFAKSSMKEHKRANNLLKPIAKDKNFMIPSTLPKEEQIDVDELKGKTGMEFSKEYMEKVVDMHEKSIDLYTRASENLEDTALSNYANKMIPDLQRHLDQAKMIQKKLEERPASVK